MVDHVFFSLHTEAATPVPEEVQICSAKSTAGDRYQRSCPWLWQPGLGDHPFDAVDVAVAQRAGAVGGDTLRERHAATAGAPRRVGRLLSAVFFCRRAEVGEIDDDDLLAGVPTFDSASTRR